MNGNIKTADIKEIDRSMDKSHMRKLEMTLESYNKGDYGVIAQFFKDLDLYGLDEAIQYVKGYVDTDEYKEGVVDELREIQEEIEGDADVSSDTPSKSEGNVKDRIGEEEFRETANALNFLEKNTGLSKPEVIREMSWQSEHDKQTLTEVYEEAFE